MNPLAQRDSQPSSLPGWLLEQAAARPRAETGPALQRCIALAGNQRDSSIRRNACDTLLASHVESPDFLRGILV